MKKGILIAAAIALFLIAAPAFAQDSELGDTFANGTFSVGLGGGFQAGTSDNNGDTTAPFVVSGKYWDTNWEIGAEAFTVLKSKSKTDDQLGQVWVAYRYDLNLGEDGEMGNGYTYIGVGVGGILAADNYNNQIGPVVLVGWDANEWGIEAKGAWYDPALISVVAYYNFNQGGEY